MRKIHDNIDFKMLSKGKVVQMNISETHIYIYIDIVFKFLGIYTSGMQ